MAVTKGKRGERLRILVLGYVVRFPFGGMTWHYLNYVLGLMELGHEVYFLEDSDDYQECCYDPIRLVNDRDPSYGISYATSVFERVGMGGHWAYYDAHRRMWLGPCAYKIDKIVSSADLLINISGSNPLRPWHMKVPVRVMIDTDPAFEQIRQLTVPARHELALKHNYFFTFGETVEKAHGSIPDDGLPWLSTRQPVVLARWPKVEPPRHGTFTTVMQWDSYPSRKFGGKEYGMKSRSFAPYLNLPKRAGHIFTLAVTGRNTPRSELRENGWIVTSATDVSLDPWDYQDFITRSRGEFSVAKHGYVVSRPGWFSERSACYLASGRPVVTQDTGFTEWLPEGAGLFSFNSPEEAAAAIASVQGDYLYHCKAARELAEEYFDSRKVLTRLLDRLAVA